jgi:hypothetical protein
VLFSGLMKRVDGSKVREVVLPPHTGVVMQYLTAPVTPTKHPVKITVRKGQFVPTPQGAPKHGSVPGN